MGATMNNSELRHRAALHDAAMQAYNRLQLENKALTAQLGKLEQENQELRRRLRTESAMYRRLQQAFNDALLMLSYQCVGLSPARDRMTPELMSIRRWDRARALLKTARVHTGTRWTTTDEDVIVRRLSATLESCAVDDSRIRMRMPRRG